MAESVALCTMQENRPVMVVSFFSIVIFQRIHAWDIVIFQPHYQGFSLEIFQIFQISRGKDLGTWLVRMFLLCFARFILVCILSLTQALPSFLKIVVDLKKMKRFSLGTSDLFSHFLAKQVADMFAFGVLAILYLIVLEKSDQILCDSHIEYIIDGS